MGIIRRVEYIRYCDVADCNSTAGSEVADWRTKEEAEQAAIRDGWVKFARDKWMCRDCKEELERREQ